MQHHHLTPSEWDALAADPEFQALLRARRAFILPSTILFVLFYLLLPIGIGVAPGFMSQRVIGTLTLAYAFGLAQFVMAWALLALYMRAARRFDERARALVTRTAAALSR